MSRVFANGPEDRGSIAGWLIPNTQKMVLDAALFITQHYKVRIKGKVEQCTERSSALPYTSVSYLLKREPSDYLRLRETTLLLFIYHNQSINCFSLFSSIIDRNLSIYLLGITYLSSIMSCPICHIWQQRRSVWEDKPTSQTSRAVPIAGVYPYSITNPMFVLLTVSLL